MDCLEVGGTDVDKMYFSRLVPCSLGHRGVASVRLAVDAAATVVVAGSYSAALPIRWRSSCWESCSPPVAVAAPAIVAAVVAAGPEVETKITVGSLRSNRLHLYSVPGVGFV